MKRKLHPYKKLFSNVYSHFIYNCQKPEAKTFLKRWMDGQSMVHTYIAMKRNKLLTHATTWINLKYIFKGADPKVCIPFIWHSRKSKTFTIKNTVVFIRGVETKRRGLLQRCNNSPCSSYIFYACIKTHRNILPQNVSFTACKF